MDGTFSAGPALGSSTLIGDALDSDSDGTIDCFDQCPGADDSLYTPGCINAIPAATEWGLVVIALALLSLGKIVFGRIDNVPA